MYLHASPHFVFDFHVHALAHEQSIANSWRRFHTIPLIDSVWRRWAKKGGNAQQQRQWEKDCKLANKDVSKARFKIFKQLDLQMFWGEGNTINKSAHKELWWEALNVHPTLITRKLHDTPLEFFDYSHRAMKITLETNLNRLHLCCLCLYLLKMSQRMNRMPVCQGHKLKKNRRTFLVSSSLYTSMINGGTAANVLEND